MAKAILLAATLLASVGAQEPIVQEFTAQSTDGTSIHGQADLPSGGKPRVAVVMSAGTGLFDRDVRFGASGTERDRLFKDLATRFTARGLAAVRYDRRGVNFGKSGAELLDKPVSGSSTTQSQRDDLNAVYRWALAKQGLGARCVILLGHSEGTLHIARLAESGAPAPLAVIGLGAVGISPMETVRWQISGRDAYSLEQMDADGDGRVTKSEVEARWKQTPSSFAGTITPLLPPDGQAWTPEQIAAVRGAQATAYGLHKTAALNLADDAPYPNADTPMAKASWWKSWFTDAASPATMLARWKVPMFLHWGTVDSQTAPHLQEPPLRTALGNNARITIHPDKGHGLGDGALLGPIDVAIAGRIADEAAQAARSCR